MIEKEDLLQRKKTVLELVAKIPLGPASPRAQTTLQYIRQDLVGANSKCKLEEVDFNSIQPGSTVLFSFGGSEASHAAVMLDKGEMAHLLQAPSSTKALERPDIGKGTLEITSPDKVKEIVQEMTRDQIYISYTQGPQSFVPKQDKRSNTV